MVQTYRLPVGNDNNMSCPGGSGSGSVNMVYYPPLIDRSTQYIQRNSGAGKYVKKLTCFFGLLQIITRHDKLLSLFTFQFMV